VIRPTTNGGVLLLNPRMLRRTKARLPLSLLHLAAVLEGRRPWRILDGNVEPDLTEAALAELSSHAYSLVGVTVMPGPQVAPAIQISSAVRAAFPDIPIVWGGYFPTLYPDSAVNAPYVDYLVRGQGESALLELLACLDGDGVGIENVRSVTWKQGGRPVHNPPAPVVSPDVLPPLPYDRLGPDLTRFLPRSFMGRRTAVHQLAVGCRYKCEFCGVVSMWNGKTRLDTPERLLAAGLELKQRWGADSLQFYDNNFFDREATSVPVLDVLAKLQMPWWCYARADTLAGFSTSTWEKIRRSRLRMTYIGAEAASDDVLARMRKGSRAEHTLEVAARCRENGVVPELSFVLGGPEDPEEEIEKTFAFVRRLKRINPDSEIILYIYSPTPQRERTPSGVRPDPGALPVMTTYGPSGPALPGTPEEWTEPRWLSWVCHQDAPWLTPRLRQRIKDFARVLSCRFPTVQDYQTPAWGRSVLRNLARWRYATGRYDRPWELDLAQRLIPLKVPQEESL
jgi:anaerobic magnesium-protoporphyrin IX monomethyl ester cyclase